MLATYVRVSTAWSRLMRRVREEQQGMTMIEYGVTAAFLVLFLVGAALLVGPKLVTWLDATIENITNGRGRTS